MNETEANGGTEVKRFVAPSMSRALELVRDEMGPEAIILSSKKVSGGVEIVTSIERDLPTRGISERRSFGQNFDAELDHAMESDVSWQSQAGVEQAAAQYQSRVERNGPDEPQTRPAGESLALEIERARERMLEAKRRAAEGESGSELRSERDQPSSPQSGYVSEQRAAQPSQSKDQYRSSHSSEIENKRKLEDMRGEIADLRMLLEQQLWQGSSESTQSGVSNNESYDQGYGQSFNQNFDKSYGQSKPLLVDEPATQNLVVEQHFERLGLSSQIVSRIAAKLVGVNRISDAWKQGLALLARSIPIASNLNTAEGGVFAFIGPTGVGKTTTLAKLAAQYTVANGSGKVALVSMDTHRVGAIEQLRALGRILDAPVRTVGTSNNLMTTLAELRDFPLILIDTAGFRQGDVLLKKQLAQLDQCPSAKRLLVLSSSSQLQTLKASIHAYRPRKGTDACVISKLDEASSLGEALTAVIQHELAVAYTTDGQQIPADAHAASAHKLVASAVSIAKQYDASMSGRIGPASSR